MTPLSQLHLVNKSPTKSDAFLSCLRHALPGSAILLYEDGVLNAIKGTLYITELTQRLAQLSIYALQPDLQARGIENLLIAGIKPIKYNDFVDLVVAYHPVVSWN